MPTFQRERKGDEMIAVEEAQRRVLEDIPLIGTEEVSLDAAHGRVLREDVVAAFDLPPADNSGMDGYAIRAADIASASTDAPALLTVIEDIPAGRIPLKRVERGTAARIMTGANVPDGADAVVQVELTDAGTNEVRVFEAVSSGTNIRRRGDDIRAGSVVLKSGTLIGPAECGVLASMNRATVEVSMRPTVAILSTGDELTDLGGSLAAGKIVNSNSYSLAALVRECGGVPRVLPVVRDTREETIAAIRSVLDCDFVISSGGVSAGAFDFVKDALEELGAEPKFWKVAMKPGKPVVFSKLRGRIYFGLPGNPVSSMVSFALFAAPALRKATGRSDLLPPVVNARAAAVLKSKGDRRTYLRVRVAAEAGSLVAHPMAAQGSHVATSMLGANGLAVVEMGTTRIDAGATVPVAMIGPISG